MGAAIVSKSILAGLVTYVALQFLVQVQYWLADYIRMRTVAQMQGRDIKEGLPLDYHYGIAGDWYYLSAVIAVLVVLYRTEWTAADIKTALIYSLVISAVLGAMWCMGGTQEAHVINRRPTLVTWPHLVYMVPVIAVLLLTFFFTKEPDMLVLGAVAIIMIVHMFVGQHMWLGVEKINNPAAYAWYSDRPLSNVVGWAILAVLALAFTWRISFIAELPWAKTLWFALSAYGAKFF